ncbi:MAG: hypothetical protein U0840_26655 [Gemmataceae bacterium]
MRRGDGGSGVTGVVSASNSLVGSTTNDLVGSGGVTVLSNGNYVVTGTSWDNGGLSDAGAVTWGVARPGWSARITSNSGIGLTASNSLQNGAVVDNVNGNFFGRFLTEGAGWCGWDPRPQGLRPRAL